MVLGRGHSCIRASTSPLPPQRPRSPYEQLPTPTPEAGRENLPLYTPEDPGRRLEMLIA